MIKFSPPIEVFPNAFLSAIGPDIDAAKVLKRRDIFVKDTTIHIQDTFSDKSNGKIAAFCRRVNDAITIAQNYAAYATTSQLIKDLDIQKDKNWNRPKITIYVNCPDTTLDPRLKPMLMALSAAIRNGAVITVKNIGEKPSRMANALNFLAQATRSDNDRPNEQHVR